VRGRPVRGLKGTGRSFIRRECFEVAAAIQNEAGNFAGGGEYGLHGAFNECCEAGS
jgi:hypothetical protein